MTLTLITPGSARAVSLAEAKEVCELDSNHRDSMVEGFLDTAITMVEDMCGQAMASQQWQLDLTGFPALASTGIPLDMQVVESIDLVTYRDAADTVQTLSASLYSLDLVSRPAEVALLGDAVWPVTSARAGSVSVKFTVAPAQRDLALMKGAVLNMVRAWFDNRMPGTWPDGVIEGLSSLRRWVI